MLSVEPSRLVCLANRAVASIASCATSDAFGLAFATRRAGEAACRVHRGVYAGSAGLVHALFALSAVTSVRRSLLDAAALALDARLAGGPLVVDAYDGIGTELALLERVAPHASGVDVIETAREVLAQWSGAQSDACPSRFADAPDLHGGAAGALATLAIASTLASLSAPPALARGLAEDLGGALALAPRGLCAPTRGARRPLVGLSHGASGIAWALRSFGAHPDAARVRRALIAYVEERGRARRFGFPDDREGVPEGVETTAFCNGAFGVAIAVEGDPGLHVVRRRAVRHVALEAASGGTGAIEPCHGDASTLDALVRTRSSAGAAAFAARLLARIEAIGFADAERGLFLSSVGAFLVVLEATGTLREHGFPFPWLPRPARASAALRGASSALVRAAVGAAFPAAGAIATARERTQLLGEAARRGGFDGAFLRRQRAPLRVALEDDIELCNHRWSCADDAAVASLARTERRSGLALARTTQPLPRSMPVRLSPRIRVRDAKGAAPRLLVHQGDCVECVEVDRALAQLLARSAAGATLGALRDDLHGHARGEAADTALRALFALGYLVAGDDTKVAGDDTKKEPFDADRHTRSILA